MGGICSSDADVTVKYTTLEDGSRTAVGGGVVGASSLGGAASARSSVSVQPIARSARSTTVGQPPTNTATVTPDADECVRPVAVYRAKARASVAVTAVGIGATTDAPPRASSSPSLQAIDDVHHATPEPLHSVPVEQVDWVRPHGLDADEAYAASLAAIQSSLFAACLTAAECASLARATQLRACNIGARIFSQHGERADFVYLIQRGEIHLQVATDAAVNPDGPLPSADGDDSADLEDDDALTASEQFHSSTPNLGTFLSPLHGRLTLSESQASTLALAAADEARRAKESRDAHVAKRAAEQRAKERERSERLKTGSDAQYRGMASALLSQMSANLPGIGTGNSSPHHARSSPSISRAKMAPSPSNAAREAAMGKDGGGSPSQIGRSVPPAIVVLPSASSPPSSVASSPVVGPVGSSPAWGGSMGGSNAGSTVPSAVTTPALGGSPGASGVASPPTMALQNMPPRASADSTLPTSHGSIFRRPPISPSRAAAEAKSVEEKEPSPTVTAPAQLTIPTGGSDSDASPAITPANASTPSAQSTPSARAPLVRQGRRASRRRTGGSLDFNAAMSASPPPLHPSTNGHARGPSVSYNNNHAIGLSQPGSPSASQRFAFPTTAGGAGTGGGHVRRTSVSMMSQNSTHRAGSGPGGRRATLDRYQSNDGDSPHAATPAAAPEPPEEDEIAPGVVRVAVLGFGQLVGICGFLSPQQVYHTTAVVHSHGTRLLCIPRSVLADLLASSSGARLRPHVSQRLVTALERAIWLRSLPPRYILTLASLFQSAQVPAGTVLFTGGDCTADHSAMYLLITGTVECDGEDDRGKTVKKTVAVNGWVGELSTVVGLCRTGSATAVTPLNVRYITRRSLMRFFQTFALIPLAKAASRSLLAFYPRLGDAQLLEQMVLQGAFAQFCLAEYSAENIEFWQTAVRFRKVMLTPAGGSAYVRSQVLTEAALMYTRYISERSLVQINLKETVRAQVRSSMKSGTLHSDTFRPAEAEILHLMIHDNWSRFKASKTYTAARDELEPPAPYPFPPRYFKPDEPAHTGYAETQRTQRTERTDRSAAGATPNADGSPPGMSPPVRPSPPWESESLSRCARVTLPAQFAWNPSNSKTEEEIMFAADGYVVEIGAPTPPTPTANGAAADTPPNGTARDGDAASPPAATDANTPAPATDNESDPNATAQSRATSPSPSRPNRTISQADSRAAGVEANGGSGPGSGTGSPLIIGVSAPSDGVDDDRELLSDLAPASNSAQASLRASSRRIRPAVTRTAGQLPADLIRAVAPALANAAAAAANPFATASHYAFASVPMTKPGTSKLAKRAKEVAKQFKHSPFAVQLSKPQQQGKKH